VRHLLNRWGLSYYFAPLTLCSTFLLLRSLLLPIFYFLLSCKDLQKKIKSRQQRPKRYGAGVALLDGS